MYSTWLEEDPSLNESCFEPMVTPHEPEGNESDRPDNGYVALHHGSFRSDIFSIGVPVRFNAALDRRVVSETHAYSMTSRLIPTSPRYGVSEVSIPSPQVVTANTVQNLELWKKNLPSNLDVEGRPICQVPVPQLCLRNEPL